MSRSVEQAVGGLVQSVFGGWGGHSGLFGGAQTGPVGTQPSLGFLSYVEKAQDARRQSREAERAFFNSAASSWVTELNRPSCSGAALSDVLQRALVAAARGYTYEALHIHALKLTQASRVAHRKIGYLYLGACGAGCSELGVMVTNTLHKEVHSSDALALLAALSALPTLLPAPLPPQMALALPHCLHHPLCLVRRRACQVVSAGVTVWAGGGDVLEAEGSSFTQQLVAGDAVAPLLQLLSDPDPSVALAATQALGRLYQHSPEGLQLVRNSVACAAAYLLTQAFNAALPAHYSLAPLHAPHAQVLMIRVLRVLCTEGDAEWRPPPVVEAALSPVLTQVWGSGPVGQCMILLEAALLALELQHATPGIRTTAANTLLGLLKSRGALLQLSVVQALTQHWSVCSPVITPLHLQALLHNLHTTTCSLLVRSTLHLLYTMANQHNYKSVMGTLVQYCGGARPALQTAILANLADLVTRLAPDPVWCCTQLQPLVLQHRPQHLTAALVTLLASGLRDGNTSLVAPTLSLISAVLGGGRLSSSQTRLMAPLLSELNEGLRPPHSSSHTDSREPTLSRGPSGAEHSTLHQAQDKTVLLITDAERTTLLSVNERFISEIGLTEENDSECVFNCFVKIGLYNSKLKSKIISLLLNYEHSSNLSRRCQAKEALVWLEHKALALKVMETQRQVLRNIKSLDWSHPFLEQFVCESLVKENVKPYLPFSVAVMSQHRSGEESLRDAHDNNPHFSSCYSTPRLTILEETGSYTRSAAAPRQELAEQPDSLSQYCVVQPEHEPSPGLPIAVSRLNQHHSSLPKLSLDRHMDDTLQSLASSSLGSAPFSICSAPIPAEGIGHTIGSSPTSPHTLHSQGDFEDCASTLTLNTSYSKRLLNSLHGGSKLLWSVEGRSLDQSSQPLNSSFELAPPSEGIELGSEACEELLVSDTKEEDVPSTAAALAKALYAGLSRKPVYQAQI